MVRLCLNEWAGLLIKRGPRDLSPVMSVSSCHLGSRYRDFLLDTKSLSLCLLDLTSLQNSEHCVAIVYRLPSQRYCYSNSNRLRQETLTNAKCCHFCVLISLLLSLYIRCKACLLFFTTFYYLLPLLVIGLFSQTIHVVNFFISRLRLVERILVWRYWHNLAVCPKRYQLFKRRNWRWENQDTLEITWWN